MLWTYKAIVKWLMLHRLMFSIVFMIGHVRCVAHVQIFKKKQTKTEFFCVLCVTKMCSTAVFCVYDDVKCLQAELLDWRPW